MIRSLSYQLILLFLLVCSQSFAAIDIYQFDSAEQEQQYKKLTEELRCLVCQNQNLADSNADLAKDLRNQIYQQLQRGADEREIIEYMVNRYGDFVLYRPPFKSSTLLLWTGPFVLLAIALIVLILFIRNRKKSEAIVLTKEEQARLQDLLQQQNVKDDRK